MSSETERSPASIREILVYQTLERAIGRAVADEPALLGARDEWNRRAGLVHDDESLYEERAAAFLEWFTLDHRATTGAEPGSGSPAHQTPAPVERFIAEASATGNGSERAALIALAASHRSLFQVREAHADGLLLEDLWGGSLLRTRERRRLTGIAPGELYDARLIADVESPPDLLLTRTLCFHPREAESAIREQIGRARRAGGDREELLFRLLRLRVRCERYRHVSPARVYGADDSLAVEK